MLGPSPCWDQMQNSKNAHPHAKIRCQTPFCFAEPFSLHIILESKHPSPPIRKMMWALTGFLSTERKADVVVMTCWKINYRFLKLTKKAGANVLTGFQVLYPSTIVIRDVLLCPLLFQPHCCVSSHQSWRCTACPSTTIMDKEDVTLSNRNQLLMQRLFFITI